MSFVSFNFMTSNATSPSRYARDCHHGSAFHSSIPIPSSRRIVV